MSAALSPDDVATHCAAARTGALWLHGFGEGVVAVAECAELVSSQAA